MLLDLFLLEMQTHYCGNPFYVTGNAIAHAVRLNKEMTKEQKDQLSVSHGIFKTFPRSAGYTPGPPTEYEEFFETWRTPRTSSPDLIVPELQCYYQPRSPTPYVLMSPVRYEGKKTPEKEQSEIPTFISFYIIGLGDMDPNIFDGIQVGGKRNMGMGKTTLRHHVRTNTSEWKGIPSEGELGVEFITPMCLESTFPGCDAVEFPEFLNPHISGRFRTREELLTIHSTSVKLKLLDSGQAFGLKKEFSQPPKLQKIIENGIERIGVHRKYGYGEYKVFAFAHQ